MRKVGISWENEESGFFIFCISLLCCRSTFPPLIQQHFRSWCQPCLLLHLGWDVCLWPGAAASWMASLQEEASWSPALLSLWGSLQKTGWRQDSSLLPQPAAWQEAMGTPLASWIPTCALPWKHGKKQPRVSRTFLYLFSWKGFLETLQWVFAIN